jgi:c-di-GMP-binding flagellar brake protein YcgR
MRKFIRHPASIPIEIAVDRDAEEAAASDANLTNISAGGLAFYLFEAVSLGSNLTISMPDIWPNYSASGTVVWCRESNAGFEAGVQFLESSEAFKARMVAQFCHIEDYRRDVHRSEGRNLTSDEAAREWIVQYAGEFAETIGWH